MKDDKSVAEETKVNEIVTDDTVKIEIEQKPAQETEWTCDHCKSLNFMIYDDRDSSYCIRKCFYYIEILQSVIDGMKIFQQLYKPTSTNIV